MNENLTSKLENLFSEDKENKFDDNLQLLTNAGLKGRLKELGSKVIPMTAHGNGTVLNRDEAINQIREYYKQEEALKQKESKSSSGDYTDSKSTPSSKNVVFYERGNSMYSNNSEESPRTDREDSSELQHFPIKP